MTTESMEVTLPTGIRIGFDVAGGGDPLVLIHGTGCDRAFWDLQVPVYAEQWQVISVDLRGSGRSDVVTDVSTYSTELMADDLAALIDHLGVGPAHVSGHSLGSCVAQQMALRHPDHVRSIQLHATWGRADTWLQRAFIGTTRFPLELGDLQTTFKTVMMWMMSADYLQTWQPEVVAGMVRSCFIDNPHLQANQGMLGHLHADAVHDCMTALPTIKTPTLVTAGESDVLIPSRYGEAVAELIPGAAFHLFAGSRASHAFNWELEPEFASVTTQFLNLLA
ncbi:MAG TPA: alpha/beta fold hydrolase [Mycobacteriales bacterium]|jgi:pimeloyl-ACP methyl ester carboxylesterase|nr:alpha/beta fold hydrolase [Mycobacteriales bacterium]